MSQPPPYPTGPGPGSQWGAAPGGYPPAPPLPASPGFTAPYAAPVHPGYGQSLAPRPTPGAPGLGLVALILAAIAALVTPVVAAIAAYPVGARLGEALPTGGDPQELAAMTRWDWSILTPVRDWVLLWEVSFWVGTVLGVWALVQGIVAIVKRRGRGMAIAAVVLAVLGPVIYGLVCWVSFLIGLGSAVPIPD